ncbi:MAG: UDP-N-acetylmuramoyl-L-alanyl-D-glutamate--2,6-diaminopimelate ligase [Spirochaetota bacterium]|nr:UDP-N-acetylmuramoyl-L-alanyl-D-glutamate--2,6-diaminopimelate ligase [Spirochaetota bacterium]
MAKSLKDIFNKLKIDYPLEKDIMILGIESDSRKIKKDFIFVAINGYKSDGHQFIDSAIQNGASCVFIEEEKRDLVSKYANSVVTIPFKNTRIVLALLAKIFYDNPSLKLKLIGVTGTNGKTTITYMIRSILQTAGLKVGLIGTICNYIDNKKIKSPVTTPDSLELNRLFYEMLLDGVTHVVMEVSSHALYLDRVYGLSFDAVIFTNLSEDHLDFHKDMDEYLNIKMQILYTLAQSEKDNTIAILNDDLDFSEKLLNNAQTLKLNYKTYGLFNKSDIQATDISFSLSNSTFFIKCELEKINIEIPLAGKFNIYNALASFAVARFLNVELIFIQAGFKKVLVPGRFQTIQSPIGANIIIDYAHTDDAIKNVLNTIRELNPNRIISVFGCGGDRDKGKRPLMGAVSGEMSDLTVITSDNPRTEEPNQILDDIIEGLNKVKGKYIKIINRYEAIQQAIEISKDRDVILIAGKGHEDYQILKDKTIHFDDKEVVENVLKELYGKSVN